MKHPLRVTFRDIPHSEAMEAEVRRRAEKLEKFYDRITSGEVVIEEPHHHHHQGRLYHVRVHLNVPGRELIVKRDPGKHHAHEDPFVAIRDAFDAMERQLQKHVRELEGIVKSRSEAKRAPRVAGEILKILPREGYGFIQSEDGREIYFNRDNIRGDGFDRLAVGARVRYVERPGREGPMASSVTVAKRTRPEGGV